MSTEPEVAKLVSMSAIDELLGEIEERNASVMERIRDAEMKLGIAAAAEHEVLALRVGGKLLEAAFSAAQTVSEAEKEEAEARTFLEDFRNRETRLETLTEEERNAENEIRHLSIRLGAMIYEQCSFSLLDRGAYRIVYDDVEEDRKLEAKDDSSILSRLLGSGKARMRKLGEESRFISYASAALESSSPVDGENANAVLSELRALKEKKAGLGAEIAAEQKALGDDREKARMLERGVETAASRIAGLRKTEEEALVSYGSYLYDKGSEWIDKDTPSSILDILEELLRLHGEHDSVLAEKDRLEREAKADDYRAMIESEEGKIMVLEKEKERIDREIAAIEKEIEALKARIARLDA